MKKILNILSAIMLVMFVSSCDLTEDPEITGTQLEKMAGEWWFETYDAAGDVVGSYHLASTSNTAANTNSDMIFDDTENWPCKIKCKVDLSSMSFVPANDIANFYDDAIKVNLKEGKIFANGATSTGGNKTDSIYIRFEFSDDPGVEYSYRGYKRTGFLEDEH